MKNKKVLAILGSPHVGGTTATMLEYTIQSAIKAGYEVTKINLYEQKIQYCTGCRVCLDTMQCVLHDDMDDITALLKECSIVMLAAPTYWANVPAPVKNFFDRSLGTAMQETATFPKPRLAGKKYMLLTSCNTAFPFSWICKQSRGTIRNMDEFFKTAGMKCIGKYVWSNTSKHKEISKRMIKKLDRCWK